MDLSEYLATAQDDILRCGITYRDVTFTVLVKPSDRLTLDGVRRRALEKIKNPRTGAIDERVNTDKLRDAILETYVVGWEDLTFGKVAKLLGKTPPASANGTSEQPVPFGASELKTVLGGIVGIEDSIWRVAVDAVQAEQQQEATDRGN